MIFVGFSPVGCCRLIFLPFLFFTHCLGHWRWYIAAFYGTSIGGTPSGVSRLSGCRIEVGPVHSLAGWQERALGIPSGSGDSARYYSETIECRAEPV